MTPQQRVSRLYWRTQGGVRREALEPPSAKLATSHLAIVEQLVAERVRVLEARRRGRALGLDAPPTPLGTFSRDHLTAKRQTGRFTEQWLAQSQTLLTRACEFFGYDRDLSTIEVRDVERWLDHWRQLKSRRSGPLTPDRFSTTSTSFRTFFVGLRSSRRSRWGTIRCGR